MAKSYNSVAVCGCSVSDRTLVEFAWGDYLSSNLGVPYHHFAGGAGSDKRGFRLLVQAIQKGEVDENTLVFFQPAECTRRELPSHASMEDYDSHVQEVVEKINRREFATPVYDKTLTKQIVSRFKLDSCHWQNNPLDKEMHRRYQEDPGCLNTDYDAEMLSVYWYMLQGLCDSKGITLVMFRDNHRGWVSPILHSDHSINIKPEWYDQSLWISVGDFMNEEERFKNYALNPPHDYVHFSTSGHIRVAEEVERILREKGVL